MEAARPLARRVSQRRLATPRRGAGSPAIPYGFLLGRLAPAHSLAPFAHLINEIRAQLW